MTCERSRRDRIRNIRMRKEAMVVMHMRKRLSREQGFRTQVKKGQESLTERPSWKDERAEDTIVSVWCPTQLLVNNTDNSVSRKTAKSKTRRS